ncbi:uncharacterized protein BYT42DRAFT_616407 [Radiomyces spectabilis]|uniref:uncharacterized protein n=1 Tax=Radiomyces spectabilis TaxID=64574 RepID=UPI002220E0E5|nr:uncharacterized protein BYT42DRAFT_618977 [Radiomyces spectabilis]XP_051420807.1 uncharacterized protein BYT42DRAFT_616857 [Radiomyces spectabilis]XP_051421368.1 uncharacterized protein BYT42DRAFT_616407 [Radiomyces spectabilis]KAI8364373.1 hypothetical protein BYT42DRAFT_618977 [Radiomyces spectabilis]KAI8371805.1 hypothetical protein BYT42DRAFT_616857 [Radiomyces spectabilis]KAI8373240.1 hypothetical protein BYT42DRAFT_616407 [Radiomyces spectabilis]
MELVTAIAEQSRGAALENEMFTATAMTCAQTWRHAGTNGVKDSRDMFSAINRHEQFRMYARTTIKARLFSMMTQTISDKSGATVYSPGLVVLGTRFYESSRYGDEDKNDSARR